MLLLVINRVCVGVYICLRCFFFYIERNIMFLVLIYVFWRYINKYVIVWGWVDKFFWEI